eukprot:scaffold202575_cov31-Tisochrysis_lutea.AAC.5
MASPAARRAGAALATEERAGPRARPSLAGVRAGTRAGARCRGRGARGPVRYAPRAGSSPPARARQRERTAAPAARETEGASDDA